MKIREFELFLQLKSEGSALSQNLRDLMIEHQRDHKLDWEDDDFEDFKLLLTFLSEIEN